MTTLGLKLVPSVTHDPSAASLLETFQATCVWPRRQVKNIAVLTSDRISADLSGAVADLVEPSQSVRLIDQKRSGTSALDVLLGGQAISWWDWADVVFNDPCESLIAASVARGFVPVVGMPKHRHGLMTARRAANVVYPWVIRGMALELSIDRPSRAILDQAAGVRTKLRPAGSVIWMQA